MAVYAVELPGHDVAAESEPFAPLTEVVEQVVAEIAERGLTRVLLWGHSAGTALAVETARKLQERGVEVERVEGHGAWILSGKPGPGQSSAVCVSRPTVRKRGRGCAV